MPCLKYVLLCIIALSGHFTTKAQKSEEAYIYGSVKSRGGEALPGASVYIKEDLKTSTVSDSKGQFILKIEAGKRVTKRCKRLRADVRLEKMKGKRSRGLVLF